MLWDVIGDENSFGSSVNDLARPDPVESRDDDDRALELRLKGEQCVGVKYFTMGH